MKQISEEIIKSFENHLFEDEKSQNTIEKYLRDVKVFAKWIGEKEIEKSHIIEYKKKLCEEFAPRSVNSILSSLNTFFSYWGRCDLKVKTIKIQKQIFADKNKELEKGEYERLLEQARKNKNYRLYYLMQTIGSTGIRISELRFITCEAVRRKEAVINCKGKMRRVFLPKNLCVMLERYIKEMNIKKGSVFVTKTGKPLDRSHIWKMMKQLCKKARVNKEKVFPHNFRHLFARTYYKVQKDIVRLADILGHTSINTTRIYTMETGEVHRKQIQMLGLIKSELIFGT